MAQVFTLFPNVAPQIDQKLGNPEDVRELEAALRPALARLNLKSLPSKLEFGKIVWVVSEAVSTISWAQKDVKMNCSLVSILIRGISIHHKWKSAGNANDPLRSEPYSFIQNVGYELFIANAPGTVSGKIVPKRKARRVLKKRPGSREIVEEENEVDTVEEGQPGKRLDDKIQLREPEHTSLDDIL